MWTWGRDWTREMCTLEERHEGHCARKPTSDSRTLFLFLSRNECWCKPILSVLPYSSLLPLPSSTGTGKCWLKGRVWTAGPWTGLQPGCGWKRAAPAPRPHDAVAVRGWLACRAGSHGQGPTGMRGAGHHPSPRQMQSRQSSLLALPSFP